MILTGSTIEEAVQRGEITISPFDASMVNPNSYNYRLGRTLKVPVADIADARRDTPCEEREIPEGGYVLQPGTVYLASPVPKGDKGITQGALMITSYIQGSR